MIKELEHKDLMQLNEGWPEKTVLWFTAKWCGPCKMITPFIEEVSSKHNDVNSYKIDIDQHGQIAQNIGIKSVPTILFIKEGKVIDTLVGFVPPETLERKYKKL